MNPIKKLKSKRGITLVEVLLVVAVMTILLAIAMPNIFAESKAIKLAAMNGYARSVAVAVQSRLYGMKNAGTTDNSEYYLLGEAAETVSIETGDGVKDVKYVTNFGKKGTAGSPYLLSGAITDTEVLKNGKIVVVYDPKTADVLEVFYSEKDFDVDSLLPKTTEDFLQEHMIGLYLGEGAPEPERKVRVPNFSCKFVFSDELYLEMQMVETPPDELLDSRLGLEIYAEIPGADGELSDEIGIYYQGFFATRYETQYAGAIEPDGDDPHALTLRKIQQNDGVIRFALDSMITDRASYGDAYVKQCLRHQNKPEYTTVTDPTLYPRESIANWFNPTTNPYMTVWHREIKDTENRALHNKIFGLDYTNVTKYVGVDKTMQLKIRLSVLSDVCRDAVGMPEGTSASFYQKDEKFASFEALTSEISPYFNAISDKNTKIAISALRDLNNLKYVFNTDNIVNRAELNQDITAQQTYDKLVKVRYALIRKNPEVNSYWTRYANIDAMNVDMLNPTKPFTLSGKSKDGGRHAIVGAGFSGRTNLLGGLFGYAYGLTVEDLDIISPSIMRNGFDLTFLSEDSDGNVNGIKAQYSHAVSGSLVGIAVNCTFKNVHVYLDKTRDLKVEEDSNTPEGDLANTNKYAANNLGYRRTSGVIAGGLVGIAIGSTNIATINGWSTHDTIASTTTTFTDCSASINVGTELYDRTSSCLYAGGLVGMTMGGVVIEGCFAASQLTGYNAGGLVGGVAKPGAWNYDNQGYYGKPYDNGWYYGQNGTGNGGLKIKKSFASGIILRQARVGGGLIADIGGTTPDVTDCYSSVKWQILPPTAYGTFEGDNKNYYIVQTHLAVPITTNIEAHFDCTGDVFSLTGKSNGVACANATDLKDKLNRSGNEWGSAEKTVFWRRENGDSYSGDGTPEKTYPFPMLNENNVFNGSWIMETEMIDGNQFKFYNDDPGAVVPENFESKCVGFFCAYYNAIWSSIGQSNVDTGVISAEKFTVDAENNVLLNDHTLDGMWWMNPNPDLPQMSGVGLTSAVTYNGEKFTFKGFAYGASLFNPLKRKEVKSGLSDSSGYIDKADTSLNWDYFGLSFGDLQAQHAYYIDFDENVAAGNAEFRENGKKDEDGNDIDERDNYYYINPNYFSASQIEILLSQTGAKIAFANGSFCVKDGD